MHIRRGCIATGKEKLQQAWSCLHTAKDRAHLAQRMARAAWREEALRQLRPAEAPVLEGLEGVEGEARMVFDAAAVLGVRHDLLSSAAARWRSLT